MDQIGAIGAALPAYVLLPTLLLSAALLTALLARVRSVSASFACFAIWTRCALSALHDFTFSASPIGMSYTALGSVMISIIGLFVLRWRRLSDIVLLPFYPLIACYLISGIHSAQVGPMNVALSKFLYLIVLALAIKDALDDIGPERLFRLLLWAFALPLLLQILSIALGVVKAGEADGSVSYIGGFHHEAAFSVVLASAVLCICMMQRVGTIAKIALIFYGLAAIILANYRTAMIAILPLVGVVLVTEVTRRFVPRQRGIVLGVMGLALGAALLAGGYMESERFADLGTVAQEGTGIIKRPEMISDDDRRILSGRGAIWSNYIYGWYDAKPLNKLIGFGPDAWTKVFPLYAHNTVVSFLYELGLTGVAALLFLWGWMLGLALLVRGGPRLQLVAGHFSFFVLNMATMPMWMIEGMIFYGILCGYTVYWFMRSRRGAGQAPAPGFHTTAVGWDRHPA
ncbi:O-antigen ligase family protein [Sphingomonas gellani]|uniref:O-antigen ligase family protein n=1 Tax=Sphingomonas gellani TaxID=1166340 RepID=UPI00147E061B|nr:O-antigen ligase family protein [Sphingomonas gellani]